MAIHKPANKDYIPPEPTGGLLDKKHFALWQLLEKYKSHQNVTVIPEPAVDWSDAMHHDFDLIARWDAWAMISSGKKQGKKFSIQSRMDAMADWMREKKW